MDNTDTPLTTHSLSSNQIKDFWLLGGLSILVWIIFLIFAPMKSSSAIVSDRFVQLAAIFSWLSFFCNYPHFLISYRFAYGRGLKFILKNWFQLIFIPLLLISLYLICFLFFSTDISSSVYVSAFNSILLKIGLTYQLGTLNLGTEILAFLVRVMYVTVGWHYSKQIFGCMMVYGKFSSYRFSIKQRLYLKLSLFSIAFYNYFYMSIPPEGSSGTDAYFFNIPITALGFSYIFIDFFKYAVFVSLALVIYFVFYKNYQETKKAIPFNVILPYIAFHIWWFPPIRQNDFYFLAIPFFHSLQYLPFAYRMEVRRGIKTNKESVFISLKVISLIVIGILAFESIPYFLDTQYESLSKINVWFFMISFAVFINIHHFFIDNTIWKFDDPKMKEKIF